MRNDFNLEIKRIAIIGCSCFFIGLLISNILLSLLIGCLLYILWNLIQIRQLEDWLLNSRKADIPNASGIWGNIFDHLSREKKRQRKEKTRLKSVIMRVETMTGALNDAVILLNKDATISWLNRSSRSLLNLKKADVNSPITNFIRNPLFVAYLYSEDHSLPLILRSPHNADQRLEFRLNHFGDGEGLLIVRDITRIFRLEQMRKDFVANVSHELRTPLTVISGYLETLSDSQQLDQRWEKPVNQMQQQASRMTTLINDLTMLSKLETEGIQKEPAAVVITPILNMIIDEITTISDKKGQSIHVHCPENLAIMGNDRELHSALSNLITNAVKYSPPNTDITVDIHTNKASGIDIQVIDNGFGIEQHHIHRLTERFYRVDSSRSIETGGTGLGLAIVKHILARHDATLRIQSRINKGSTFIASFPQSRVASL